MSNDTSHFTKPKVCPDCLCEFVPERSGSQKYCLRCKEAFHTGHLNLYVRKCEECGDYFVGKRQTSRFCRPKCAKKTLENELLYNLKCEMCGEEFPANYRQFRVGKRFCDTNDKECYRLWMSEQMEGVHQGFAFSKTNQPRWNR